MNDPRLTLILTALWEALIILARAVAKALGKPSPFPVRRDRRQVDVPPEK